MKLDKQLLTTHAKRLQAILNEKSTFAPYIARPDFSKVLEISLNTLHAAEKKLTTVELANKLSAKSQVKEFNKLGKNTFKLDEKFKYEDEGELIDNINYLATYCNNIFKVNLDALVEGKQVTASNPTIDLKAKPEPEEVNASAAFAAGMGNYGEAAAYGNPFVMGQAYAKVKEDMATGKLYSYSSKPRIILLAKWAAVATIGLTILALIITAIFAFMSSKFQVQYTKSDGSTYTDGLNFNAIGPGIMYILIAAFGGYPLYQLINGIISKNDNIRFYLNWPWILIFILMALIFVMPDMRVTWLLSPSIIKETVGSNSWNAFQGWKIMYIIALSCSGLCLIPMIIGAVCNPKQNKNIIEQKLKEYVDQAMAAGGMGGQTAASTGTDVQKPVEVKKPENKKSEDKKTDKSKDKK